MFSEGLKLPDDIFLFLKTQMGLRIDLVSSSVSYWTATVSEPWTRLDTGVLVKEKDVARMLTQIVISL